MKKNFIIFTALFTALLFNLNAYAIESVDEDFETYPVYNFLNKEKDDKTQIKDLLYNLNKYSNTHEIDKIKQFYSKDYISYDGFDLDAYIAAIKETFETYPDISYKSKIKSINVFDGWASAELTDTSISEKQALTQAIVNNKPVFDRKIDGVMESECNYVIYLKKIRGRWQIYSDNIISESTSIKYGNARELKMGIVSPPVIKEGEEYCISLNIENKPEEYIMLASLSAEEIKYPPATPKDIFRKFPSQGPLERIVRANKNGVNEYSLASVGITEISLNEEKTAINYEMSGIAFLMKRVNVYTNKNVTDKEYVDKMLKKEKL